MNSAGMPFQKKSNDRKTESRDLVIKGIIFDLDGLLVDTEKTYREGWLWTFKQYDLPISETEVDSWSGRSWLQTASYIASIVGKEKVPEIRRKREEFIYRQLASGTLKAKPFAAETLAFCKQKNLAVGLATSTVKKRAVDLLTHFDLLNYFDEMTFGDEVTEHKPAPTVYLTALAKSQLHPTEALAVEDSIIGATAATRAGLGVLLVPDSSFAPPLQEKKASLNLVAEGPTLKIVENYLTE